MSLSNLLKKRKKSLNIAQSKMLGVRWLEHRWLIYHGYFERVHEFLDFFPITLDITIYGIITDLLS